MESRHFHTLQVEEKDEMRFKEAVAYSHINWRYTGKGVYELYGSEEKESKFIERYGR